MALNICVQYQAVIDTKLSPKKENKVTVTRRILIQTKEVNRVWNRRSSLDSLKMLWRWFWRISCILLVNSRPTGFRAAFRSCYPSPVFSTYPEAASGDEMSWHEQGNRVTISYGDRSRNMIIWSQPPCSWRTDYKSAACHRLHWRNLTNTTHAVGRPMD